MRMLRYTIIAASLAVVVAGTAQAQGKGKIGLEPRLLYDFDAESPVIAGVFALGLWENDEETISLRLAPNFEYYLDVPSGDLYSINAELEGAYTPENSKLSVFVAAGPGYERFSVSSDFSGFSDSNINFHLRGGVQLPNDGPVAFTPHVYWGTGGGNSSIGIGAGVRFLLGGNQ